MVVNTWNTSTLEAEAERWPVQGQLGLYHETLLNERNGRKGRKGRKKGIPVMIPLS
jgi:hypothetical protein